MLRKVILSFCLIFVLIFPLICMGADTVSKKPDAFLPESLFEFEPVLEGLKVSHEFKIFNKGDAALEILKTESG